MRTLPQLAVSAKLLCLLMVVICGAVPSMVRSVRLYNDCSSSDVRVDSSGRVLADYDKANDKYTNLTIRSVDFGVKLTIYAEAAKRYLCFNRNWKLIGSKRFKGSMCQFYEDMVDNGYNRYRSAANESYFVGFNRKGRPLKAAEIVPRSRSNTPRRHKPHIRAKCLNFMKRDSVFSIGNHNSRMGGNHNPHSFSLSDHNRFLRYSGTSRGVGLPYRRGKIGAREEEKRPEKDLRKRHGAKGRGKGS